MSSQNDNSGAHVGIAFVAVGVYFAALFLFAVAAFLSFVLTVLSLMAWRKPLHLSKDIVITPEEAHGFVKRGIVGGIAAPFFAAFAGILLDFDIHENQWSYVILGGYVGGSLIMEIMIQSQKEKEEQAKAAMLMMMPPTPPQPPAPPARTPTRERANDDFHFASWDDEEELDERS